MFFFFIFLSFFGSWCNLAVLGDVLPFSFYCAADDGGLGKGLEGEGMKCVSVKFCCPIEEERARVLAVDFVTWG